jgi:D-alanyl-D-alanine dipeptidase
MKKEKNFFGNLPVEIIEYIRLVIRKMNYRRRVCEDVAAELAAHFEEELKDCKTDEDRQQKSKQIIENFGDTKLLGILLRRAKKRCRPLWRTALVRSLQAAGLFVLFLIVYSIWFLTGKPVITTDYLTQFNSLVRPVADESQNAAPLYEKAVQLFGESRDYNDIKQIVGKKYDEVTPQEKERLEKWIAGNREIFDLAIEGSARPYYWQAYYVNNPNQGMLGILMPSLAEFRNIARLLTWRAQLSAQQGRYEDSFNDLTACYRFGRHLRQGNITLVEQLVGIAIEALSVQAIRNILGSYEIDTAILAALQQDMEQAIAGENFAVNFAAEKLFIYDEIQRTFTDDSLIGGHLCLRGFSRLLALTVSGSHSSTDVMLGILPNIPYILFIHPNRKETKYMIERHYDFMEKVALKSPAQVREERIDIDEESMKIIRGNLLLEMLSPAFNKVIEISNRIKMDVQATITVIALQRYKNQKGQYPESLDELVTTGFLKELPIDPWSDKPLVYRRTETGFTLYGIGINFIDDGGKMGLDNSGRPTLWQRNGDWVFWPVVK